MEKREQCEGNVNKGKPREACNKGTRVAQESTGKPVLAVLTSPSLPHDTRPGRYSPATNLDADWKDKGASRLTGNSQMQLNDVARN